MKIDCDFRRLFLIVLLYLLYLCMKLIIRLLKMKHIVLPLLFVLSLFFLYSCKAVKTEESVYTKKQKTVLVYIIGNNSLSSDAVSSFTQIRSGYIPENEGNLLVYFHTNTAGPVLYNITKNKEGEVVTDTAYVFPSRNSATSTSIKQALSVSATLFPANEYGLVLWSHGTGWLPSGYYASGSFSSSSAVASVFNADPYASFIKMARNSGNGMIQRTFGSESEKEIEITDLATAFPFKLSFIMFDACLMGGIEVAYELKEYADYMIFSPAEVLTTSFPYSVIMKHIFATPSDLKGVCEEYYNFYDKKSGELRSATVSLVDCAQLTSLAAVAKEIFAGNRGKIATLNMSDIQGYFRGNKPWFYDIQDFIGKIATQDQLAKFNDALSKVVTYKAATPYFLELKIDRFSGVSTYIPNPSNSQLEAFYKNFKWNIDTGMIE